MVKTPPRITGLPNFTKVLKDGHKLSPKLGLESLAKGIDIQPRESWYDSAFIQDPFGWNQIITYGTIVLVAGMCALCISNLCKIRALQAIILSHQMNSVNAFRLPTTMQTTTTTTNEWYLNGDLLWSKIIATACNIAMIFLIIIIVGCIGIKVWRFISKSGTLNRMLCRDHPHCSFKMCVFYKFVTNTACYNLFLLKIPLEPDHTLVTCVPTINNISMHAIKQSVLIEWSGTLNVKVHNVLMKFDLPSSIHISKHGRQTIKKYLQQGEGLFVYTSPLHVGYQPIISNQEDPLTNKAPDLDINIPSFHRFSSMRKTLPPSAPYYTNSVCWFTHSYAWPVLVTD